ncbi:MAG: response regulator transcription factor [Pseudomonadota bacterium]|jgi:Response regulators consisting of a CheY-like receiver domain and a winged-helix DNA-binding domain|nr:MAG: DNA-binding response regulator [Pseudomonadota bacterium]
MKLLLVDDDADLRAVTGFALRQAGFVVVEGISYGTGLATFTQEQPQLALLDINLPGGSGFDLCAEIRRRSSIPIMMLTVRGEEDDVVRALELGADDYLTKPFSPRTLVARVRALLRRAGGTVDSRTRVGRIQLDPESLELRIEPDVTLRLTRLEMRLMQLLLANADQPVQTDRLLMHVWGHKGGGDRQLLKQLVHRLRQKLGDDGDAPRLIETVSGVGYRLRTGE